MPANADPASADPASAEPASADPASAEPVSVEPVAAPPPDPAVIGFRRLEPADLALLRHWLAEPHVRRWWNHDTSAAAVERDFGPTMRGAEPGEDLVVEADGIPVGLLQHCRWEDYPDYLAEAARIVDVPRGAVTFDYLIGPAELVGRGLGTRVLRAAVAEMWRRHPDAPAIIVPVNAANTASWRALEKAGFTRIGTGDLEPDNPIDPPLHHLHRIDRGLSG